MTLHQASRHPRGEREPAAGSPNRVCRFAPVRRVSRANADACPPPGPARLDAPDIGQTTDASLTIGGLTTTTGLSLASHSSQPLGASRPEPSRFPSCYSALPCKPARVGNQILWASFLEESLLRPEDPLEPWVFVREAGLDPTLDDGLASMRTVGTLACHVMLHLGPYWLGLDGTGNFDTWGARSGSVPGRRGYRVGLELGRPIRAHRQTHPGGPTIAGWCRMVPDGAGWCRMVLARVVSQLPSQGLTRRKGCSGSATTPGCLVAPTVFLCVALVELRRRMRVG